MSLRAKFDYIHNHYYYYTMHSWNGLKSLANNVKVWNLPLTSEQRNKFFELCSDEQLETQLYDVINSIIYDYEAKNKTFEAYFNGRSGGYLVLTQKKHNGNIIDDEHIENDSYDALIKYFVEYNGWSFRDAQAEAKRRINQDFEIVKEFDELCDELLHNLIYILDNCTIEEEKEEYPATRVYKTLVY